MDTIKRMVSLAFRHPPARFQLLNITRANQGVTTHAIQGFASQAPREQKSTISKSWLDFDELRVRYNHISRIDSIRPTISSGEKYSRSISIAKFIELQKESQSQKLPQRQMYGDHFYGSEFSEGSDTKYMKYIDNLIKVQKEKISDAPCQMKDDLCADEHFFVDRKEEPEVPECELGTMYASTLKAITKFFEFLQDKSLPCPAISAPEAQKDKSSDVAKYGQCKEDTTTANHKVVPHARSGLVPLPIQVHEATISKSWLDFDELRFRSNHISRFNSMSQKHESRPVNISNAKLLDAGEEKDSKNSKYHHANFSVGKLFSDRKEKESLQHPSSANISSPNPLMTFDSFLNHLMIEMAKAPNAKSDLSYNTGVFEVHRKESLDHSKSASENFNPGFVFATKTQKGESSIGARDGRVSSRSYNSSGDSENDAKYKKSRNSKSCADMVYEIRKEKGLDDLTSISGNSCNAGSSRTNDKETQNEPEAEEQLCGISNTISKSVGVRMGDLSTYNSTTRSENSASAIGAEKNSVEHFSVPNDEYSKILDTEGIFETQKQKDSAEKHSMRGNWYASYNSEAPKEHGASQSDSAHLGKWNDGGNKKVHPVKSVEAQKEENTFDSKSISENSHGTSFSASDDAEAQEEDGANQSNSATHSGPKHYLENLLGIPKEEASKKLYAVRSFEAHKEGDSAENLSVRGNWYASTNSEAHREYGARQSNSALLKSWNDGDSKKVHPVQSLEAQQQEGSDYSKSISENMRGTSFSASDNSDVKEEDGASQSNSATHSGPKHYFEKLLGIPKEEASKKLYAVRSFEAQKEGDSAENLSMRGNWYASTNSEAHREYGARQSNSALLKSWNYGDSKKVHPVQSLEAQQQEGSDYSKFISENMRGTSFSASDNSDVTKEDGASQSNSATHSGPKHYLEKLLGIPKEEASKKLYAVRSFEAHKEGDSAENLSMRENWYASTNSEAQREHGASQSNSALLKAWNDGNFKKVHPVQSFEAQKEEGSDDSKSMSGKMRGTSFSACDNSDVKDEDGASQSNSATHSCPKHYLKKLLGLPNEEDSEKLYPVRSFEAHKEEDSAENLSMRGNWYASTNSEAHREYGARQSNSALLKSWNDGNSKKVHPVQSFEAQKEEGSDYSKSMNEKMRGTSFSASDNSDVKEEDGASQSNSATHSGPKHYLKKLLGIPKEEDTKTLYPFRSFEAHKEEDSTENLSMRGNWYASTNSEAQREYGARQSNSALFKSWNDGDSKKVHPVQSFEAQKEEGSDDSKSMRRQMRGTSFSASDNSDVKEEDGASQSNSATHSGPKHYLKKLLGLPNEEDSKKFHTVKSYEAHKEEDSAENLSMRENWYASTNSKAQRKHGATQSNSALLKAWNDGDSKKVHTVQSFEVQKEEGSDYSKSISENWHGTSFSASDDSEAQESEGAKESNPAIHTSSDGGSKKLYPFKIFEAQKEETAEEQTSMSRNLFASDYAEAQKEDGAGHSNSAIHFDSKFFLKKLLGAPMYEQSNKMYPATSFEVLKGERSNDSKPISENSHVTSFSASDDSEAQEEDGASQSNSATHSGSKYFLKKLLGTSKVKVSEKFYLVKNFDAQKEEDSKEPTSMSGKWYASDISEAQEEDGASQSNSAYISGVEYFPHIRHDGRGSPSANYSGLKYRLKDYLEAPNDEDSKNFFPVKNFETQKKEDSEEQTSRSGKWYVPDIAQAQEEERASHSNSAYIYDAKYFPHTRHDGWKLNSATHYGSIYLLKKVFGAPKDADSKKVYPAKILGKCSNDSKFISGHSYALSVSPSDFSKTQQAYGSEESGTGDTYEVDEEESAGDVLFGDFASDSAFVSGEKYFPQIRYGGGQSNPQIRHGSKYLLAPNKDIYMIPHEDGSFGFYPVKFLEDSNDSKSVSENLFANRFLVSDFTEAQQEHGLEDRDIGVMSRLEQDEQDPSCAESPFISGAKYFPAVRKQCF